MISAADTNILLDILIPNPAYVTASLRLLTESHQAGAVIVSEPVYAELAALFPDRAALEAFLQATGVRLQPSDALARAGRAWRGYRARRPAGLICPNCGRAQSVVCDRCGAAIATRQHVVAEFLIGAHATVHADRLLTRDRGYYATYFPSLTLVP